MKLEDIDGEVYITDSLKESLQASIETSSFQKYTVTVGSTAVGVLKGYRSYPPVIEIDFECTTDPGTLITLVAGQRLSIAGIDLGFDYSIGEVSCNIETLRCKLRAIHIEEVEDERRESDLRVRQVHGVD